MAPLLQAQGLKKIPLPCARVDLVLVFDRSGSVSTKEQDDLIKSAVVGFTTRLEVHRDAVNIGIGVFNAVPNVLLELTGDQSLINDAVVYFPIADGGTSLAAGFDAARDIFTGHVSTRPDRKDVKRVLVYFSDGESDDYNQAQGIAEDLKQGTWTDDEDVNAKVTIFTVNTDKMHGKKQLGDLASSSAHYKVAAYGEVYDLLMKLNICS